MSTTKRPRGRPVKQPDEACTNHVNVRVPDALYDRVHARARAQRVSVPSIFRAALQRALLQRRAAADADDDD
jgi:predicted HicB family RNase H-like nuclease